MKTLSSIVYFTLVGSPITLIGLAIFYNLTMAQIITWFLYILSFLSISCFFGFLVIFSIVTTFDR